MRNILLITGLLVALFTFDSVAGATPAELVGPPERDLPPLSAAEAALVDDVLAAYAAIGLGFTDADLPTIGFSRDAADCDGQLAAYRPLRNPEVRVCWIDENPAVERVLRTQALTHELAHAWTASHLDDSDRVAYLELTGLESWRSAEIPWEARGIEHAAELLTWAVFDPSVRFIEFDEAECRTWSEAFELMTGQAAPETVASC